MGIVGKVNYLEETNHSPGKGKDIEFFGDCENEEGSCVKEKAHD